jgi:hypothetical protein
MEQHGFASVEDFRGASLPYFTTHAELVRLQREALAAKKRARTGLAGDADWSGDGFVRCGACARSSVSGTLLRRLALRQACGSKRARALQLACA